MSKPSSYSTTISALTFPVSSLLGQLVIWTINEEELRGVVEAASTTTLGRVMVETMEGELWMVK